MQFKIEQVAIMVGFNRERAMAFLAAIGLTDWVHDHVKATGAVGIIEPTSNEADLAFNYQTTRGMYGTPGASGSADISQLRPLEFELLTYTEGSHWLDEDVGLAFDGACVSHLGMHVTAEELVQWKLKMAELGVDIAQEVRTQSHTNDFLLKTGRRYHYTIFNTRQIIGVDLKFIVRIEANEPVQLRLIGDGQDGSE